MPPADTADTACAAGLAVLYAALARGLSFKVAMGDVLQLTPPLTVRDVGLESALSILEAAITEVEIADGATVG